MTVLNREVDPRFGFMSRDWDGQIRMDPSSAYAMQSVIEKSKGYDLCFACDTDHDRHGIVTPNHGLMQANHYLAVSIDYLFRNRPQWPTTLQIGKTLVSSQMIDRVAAVLPRGLYEVPVGFKWFVDGLAESKLGFVGEESAGSTFLRRNGRTWTTDKDGIAAALLSAEMTAKLGKNPAALYRELTQKHGDPAYSRIEAKASPAQKNRLKALSPEQIKSNELAGEKITKILTKAPANHASLGGIKVETQNGWFAARPSGTEDIYKIYAESFRGAKHLASLLEEAQKLVDESVGPQ
jgi:phosphoglucomutase